MDTIEVNRAPVLTLWAAVVAERLGFEPEEALTLGKSVAGLTAQSKGQRLGIFTPSPDSVRRARAEKAKAGGRDSRGAARSRGAGAAHGGRLARRGQG